MKSLSERIEETGYRITRARRQLIACLEKARRPLSAQEIHALVAACDLASVYRFLSVLEENRLVAVETIGNEKRYCYSTRPHHHIICRNCGHTAEIPCRHDFDNIKGFADVEHRLSLSGICKACNK